MRYEPALPFLFATSVTFAATASLAAPLEIGTAETVVPAVESENLGAVTQLEPGAQIFQDEVIRTYRIGATGLRFVDRTTLTVYPNTSLKLDRFVYNADKTVAEVALNLLKGAFRIASGGPRTSEKYKIETPHVTLGIRGTVVHIFAEDDVSTVQALHGTFEGCSRISGVCKLVQATDQLNGVRYWKSGRIELGRFSPDLGVRFAPGMGAALAAPGQVERVASAPIHVEAITPAPPRRTIIVPAPPVLPMVARPIHGAVCFARGALILTPLGERRIEELRVGDLVVTGTAGAQRIKWVAQQRFVRRGRGEAWGAKVAPVLIEAGALGPEAPHRTLLLSPHHAVLVDGVLVQAKQLVDGGSIRQVDYSGLVLEYFNLEFDAHQIIFANGLAVESYRPSEPRAREHWSNFAEYAQRYPGREHSLFDPVAPLQPRGRGEGLRARLGHLLGRTGAAGRFAGRSAGRSAAP